METVLLTRSSRQDLKHPDDAILTELLCFWTLTIFLFLFKTHSFGDWILPLSSGESLVSWAQSMELVGTMTVLWSFYPMTETESSPRKVVL
jgi:hypothetical protein